MELKAASLIDRKQVKLVRNKNKISCWATPRKTQCGSRDFHGIPGSWSQLYQLVLTDYIRQDLEVHLGDKDAQFTQLGVLFILNPFAGKA